MGIDMLLYALIDPMVDGYFPVIDRISDEIDQLEDDVMEATTTRSSRGCSMFAERWSRCATSSLQSGTSSSSSRTARCRSSRTPTALYFRDVYDHTLRVTDELDTHRELVSGVLDAYLTSVNNNLSDVMKRLTAITAVLAGIGAAAGIFGMSEAATALGLPGPIGFWLVAARRGRDRRGGVRLLPSHRLDLTVSSTAPRGEASCARPPARSRGRL